MCLQELQPLVFMFDLASFPLTAAAVEGSRMPVVRQVQQSYAVTVTIRPHHHHQHSISTQPYRDACVVIVRGSVTDCDAVKEATRILFEQLTGGIRVCTMFFFSSTLILNQWKCGFSQGC